MTAAKKTVKDYLNQPAGGGRRFLKWEDVGVEIELILGPVDEADVKESYFEGKPTLDANGEQAYELHLPATIAKHSEEKTRGYDGPRTGDKVTWVVKTGARIALKDALEAAERGLEDNLRLLVTRTKDRKTNRGKAFQYDVEVLADRPAPEADEDDSVKAKALLDELG